MSGEASGPSARKRQPQNAAKYKTKLCRNWANSARCAYGSRCTFAHGDDDQLKVGQNVAKRTIAQEASPASSSAHARTTHSTSSPAPQSAEGGQKETVVMQQQPMLVQVQPMPVVQTVQPQMVQIQPQYQPVYQPVALQPQSQSNFVVMQTPQFAPAQQGSGAISLQELLLVARPLGQ
eukprot:TRINITY_DN11461_c0_g1_i2.p1 TRINITY_DN11461_c0_g1~~TRINITY_DN11461_c0_g1_i2.p1  ORF type:complete len:202 (+),score=17.75 TRINITY_DN11461_c0_g1_i2:73-606(+)